MRAASAASIACDVSAGAGDAPGGADALAQVRLALLAHVVGRALAAADHERHLGLLAAQRSRASRLISARSGEPGA